MLKRCVIKLWPACPIILANHTNFLRLSGSWILYGHFQKWRKRWERGHCFERLFGMVESTRCQHNPTLCIRRPICFSISRSFCSHPVISNCIWLNHHQFITHLIPYWELVWTCSIIMLRISLILINAYFDAYMCGLVQIEVYL